MPAGLTLRGLSDSSPSSAASSTLSLSVTKMALIHSWSCPDILYPHHSSHSHHFHRNGVGYCRLNEIHWGSPLVISLSSRLVKESLQVVKPSLHTGPHAGSKSEAVEASLQGRFPWQVISSVPLQESQIMPMPIHKLEMQRASWQILILIFLFDEEPSMVAIVLARGTGTGVSVEECLIIITSYATSI
jgi:hypothetical protein